MQFRIPRRALAVVVALTLAAVALGARPSQSAEAASASAPPTESVLAGSDRYETAIAISKDSYPTAGSAKTVVIASGLDFPDALSAAPAAVKLGGPLLLTVHDGLLPAVAAEVKRLAPKRIVVVGGTAALSDAVVSSLNSIAPTTRVAGADRYATSLAIAEFAFGSTNVPTLYFATGAAFPDALSASAYAGATGAPVLLVPGNTYPWMDLPDSNQSLLPPELVSWVKGAHITQFDMVGGDDAINYSMRTAIGSLVGDLGVFIYPGANRFETNRLIIDDNPSPIYSGVTAAYLASGMNFPDALAGAAAAGKAGEPLILVEPSCVPAATLQMITSMGIDKFKVLGGHAAVGTGAKRLTACGS